MHLLDDPGIVRVADTNAEDFRKDVELFLVTQRVNGTDLEKLVEAAPMSLEDAVRVTLAVLRTLDHCHKRGVIHRDIKPCHVILRRNALDDPVLIDFGLAYHSETQPDDAETLTGEGKGNRFLITPEQLIGNPDTNRNSATDICQCIGLLFYALTQMHPRVLRDTNDKKPHERLAKDIFRPEVQAWKRKAVLQLFDVGFEWDPGQRWQTIDLLKKRLEPLLGSDEPTEVALELELASLIRRATTSSHTARMKKAREMADKLVDVARSVTGVVSKQVVSKQVEKYLSVHCSPVGFHGDTLAMLLIAFTNNVDGSKSKTISFAVQFTNRGQVEVFLTPYNGTSGIFKDNPRMILGSYDLGSAECCDTLRPVLERNLITCVAEVLGIDSE